MSYHMVHPQNISSTNYKNINKINNTIEPDRIHICQILNLPCKIFCYQKNFSYMTLFIIFHMQSAEHDLYLKVPTVYDGPQIY